MRNDAVLQTILGTEPARYTLPLELLTTDRVLKRWAVGSGTGLPSDEFDDQPRATLTPLPDDVAIDVDECILSSPRRTRTVITRWYRTPEPAEVIAHRLSVSIRNLYRYHSIALNFMRWKFEGSGNTELVRLIRAVDK